VINIKSDCEKQEEDSTAELIDYASPAAREAVGFLLKFDSYGRHNLVAIDPEEKLPLVGRTFAPGAGQAAAMAAFVQRYDGKRNLYFSVNEPLPGSPNNKLAGTNIGRARAVYVDVDPAKDADLPTERKRIRSKLEAFEPRPTSVIDTGGGYAAYWMLTGNTMADDAFEDQLNGACAELDGDTACVNRDRVMRLPGTVNLPSASKRARGRTARKASVIWQNGPTYTREYFAMLVEPKAKMRTKAATSRLPICELDQPRNIDKAIEYLRNFAPEAIEGAGGDRTTFAIAAELRQYGLSEGQTFELMAEHWNATGKASPPWDLDELTEKVENAFAHATGVWGGKSVGADFFDCEWTNEAEFEAIGDALKAELRAKKRLEAENDNAPSDAGEAKPDKRPKFFTVPLAEAARTALDVAEPLVDGVLDVGSSNVLYGPSNSGKTFVALSLAAAIASGQPWAGRKVKPGAVIYVAAEAKGSIRKRFAALVESGLPSDAPLHLAPCEIDLFDPKASTADVVKSARDLAARSEPVQLVVVDTLARAMGAGDENTVTDMSAFVRHIDVIREKTGAAVLIVHHTGKDVAKGARGSSALKAAIDAEISVEKEKGQVLGKIVCEKQRDSEFFEDIKFSLRSVELGARPDGAVVTSCVVKFESGDFEPIDPVDMASDKAKAFLKHLVALGGTSKWQAWRAAACKAVDKKWRPGKTEPDGCSDTTLRRLRDELVDATLVKEVSSKVYRIA
jgi:hypothetical protein